VETEFASNSVIAMAALPDPPFLLSFLTFFWKAFYSLIPCNKINVGCYIVILYEVQGNGNSVH
jgi:hypothetical protein